MTFSKTGENLSLRVPILYVSAVVEERRVSHFLGLFRLLARYVRAVLATFRPSSHLEQLEEGSSPPPSQLPIQHSDYDKTSIFSVHSCIMDMDIAESGLLLQHPLD